MIIKNLIWNINCLYYTMMTKQQHTVNYPQDSSVHWVVMSALEKCIFLHCQQLSQADDDNNTTVDELAACEPVWLAFLCGLDQRNQLLTQSHISHTLSEISPNNCSWRDTAETGSVPHRPHHGEPLNITTSSSVHFDDRLDISKFFCFNSWTADSIFFEASLKTHP